MKKHKLKFNTSRFVARGAAILLLVFVSLGVCACTDGGLVSRKREFTTHAQFKEFLHEYNSKNDGTVSSFISVDFDGNDSIPSALYVFQAVQKYSENNLYDNNTNYIYSYVYMYFFSDVEKTGLEYKIKCTYYKKDIHFSNDDVFSVQQIDPSSKSYSVKSIDYCDEINSQTDAKYNYVYQFDLLINSASEMSIKISSVDELSDDNLNKICALLTENLVIINTEG